MAEKVKEALIDSSPRTALGKKLSKIRSRIIASGEFLLDWDDLEKEKVERQGEKREREDEKTGLC